MSDIRKLFSQILLGENKNEWETYADIICFEPDENLKPYISIMLDWIEEIDTPGAFTVYCRLEKISKVMMKKTLKEKIEFSLAHRKYIWGLWMIDLLANDKEKELFIEKIKTLNSVFKILDMLDYNNDIITQERGIKLGKKEEDFSIFIQPYTPQYGQEVWSNCAEILYSKSDEELEKYLPKILQWLQDLNWHGSLLILERLQKCSNIILEKYLNESIHMAIETKDSNWLYGLEQLIVDINERKRIELVCLEIEIENEEKSYFEMKRISLNKNNINIFLNDLNKKHLRIGALSALAKVADNTFSDFFLSFKSDSDEHIRRIVQKFIEKN